MFNRTEGYIMKILRYMTAVLLLHAISVSYAGEYAWFEDLNVEAHADRSGFKARLAARFKIGDASVQAVIDQTGGRPADAYMVLRLGEMAHLPVETVLDRYHANNGRGWGVLAKNLGIKPGSREFHNLKRGHDLQGYARTNDSKAKNKGNSHKTGYSNKGKSKPGKGKGNNG